MIGKFFKQQPFPLIKFKNENSQDILNTLHWTNKVSLNRGLVKNELLTLRALSKNSLFTTKR